MRYTLGYGKETEKSLRGSAGKARREKGRPGKSGGYDGARAQRERTEGCSGALGQSEEHTGFVVYPAPAKVASGAPWWHGPNRLVSWWDMEKFSAETYFAIARLFEVLRSLYGVPRVAGDSMFPQHEYALSSNQRRNLVERFSGLAENCKNIGLTVSTKNVEAFVSRLAFPQPLSNKQTAWEIDKALQLVTQEMEAHLFLYVPAERATWYSAPTEGWAEVICRFPSTINDIEEAARCFACDRYAGSVFHALQVGEVGAVEIGKLIGIRDPKAGWPTTIREMRRIVQRTKFDELKPVEQQHRTLLEQLLPIMESMQDGWRNKISHVENKLVLLTGEFSPQVAEEILIATRAFMRRLATDMPNPKT